MVPIGLTEQKGDYPSMSEVPQGQLLLERRCCRLEFLFRGLLEGFHLQVELRLDPCDLLFESLTCLVHLGGACPEGQGHK